MSTYPNAPGHRHVDTSVAAAVALIPPALASVFRCHAQTRRGTECQAPAVKGKRRCRMHGGTNPGAPEGNRNAWKHGGRSAEAMAAARFLRSIARLVSNAVE